MKLKLALAGAALLLAGSLVAGTANAAPATLLDGLKAAAADASQVEKTAFGPCVWSRFRGWHRNGPYGSWRSCTPGPGWRYSQRCWIGPNGARNCRF